MAAVRSPPRRASPSPSAATEPPAADADTVTVNSTRGAALEHDRPTGSHGIYRPEHRRLRRPRRLCSRGGRQSCQRLVRDRRPGQGRRQRPSWSPSTRSIRPIPDSTAEQHLHPWRRLLGISPRATGGGGGDGAFAISAAAGVTYGGLAFSIGGNGAVAGNGGAVTVTSDAAITTAGRQLRCDQGAEHRRRRWQRHVLGLRRASA